MIFLTLLTLFIEGANVKPQKAYIVPLPLEDENDPRTFLSFVKQLEIDKDLLYIRPANSAHILVFDKDRKFLFKIGGKGGGPGEFATVLSGFGVSNGNVWAFEKGSHISYFQGPKYITNIPIKGVQISIHGSSSARFIVNDDMFLLGANPRTRHLGVAYAYDGNTIQGVGNIFPIKEEVLLRNPAYNDVLWVEGGKEFYAVFEYHPLVQVYDRNFQLVREFTFDTVAVKEFEDQWGDWQPKEGWRIPFELNRDVSWHDGHLWILCNGALLKFNPKSGHLLNVYHFFGKGPKFKNHGRLHFYTFDFFSDSQLLISTTDDGWGSHIYTSKL